MSFECDMNSKQQFRSMIRKKLPNDLKLHLHLCTFQSDYWEVKYKGFFGLFKPTVCISNCYNGFRIFNINEISLAKRLAKIFSDIKFKSNVDEVCDYLNSHSLR